MRKLILVIVILSLFACAEFSNDHSSGEVLKRQKRKILLYPDNTVLQLTMCIISQISFIPSHRVAINLGFNVNYALPNKLSGFYSPMFWASRLMSGETNPIMSFMDKFIESESKQTANFTRKNEIKTEDSTTQNSDESEDTTAESTTEDEDAARRKKRSEPEVKGDLSAAEFYYGLKETLVMSGYHESCLLKSVCELAKHPIHDDHADDNLIHELVHLVLTPSEHQSFDTENESDEQRTFEEAEMFGKSGGDCDFKYGSKCLKSPLESVSHYIHSNNDV